MAFSKELQHFKELGKLIEDGKLENSENLEQFEDPSKIVEMMETVEKIDEKQTRIGFTFSISRDFSKLFSSFSDPDKDRIRSSLLGYIRTVKHMKELIYVLNMISFAQTSYKKEWNELFDFVFSSDNDNYDNDFIRGHLLTSMDVFRDEELINKHVNEVVPLIKRLLTSKFDEQKIMLISLLSLCDFKAIDEELTNIIWNVAVDVAKSDKYRSIYPAMQQFCEIEGFKNAPAKAVSSIVETFGDENSDLEIRLTAVLPLLRLFPFLNDDIICSIVNSSLSAFELDYFSSTTILSHLGEADLELLNNDTVTVITSILCTELEKGRAVAVVALFAPFADLILNEAPENLDLILNAIVTLLKKQDEVSLISGLTSLRSLIYRFSSPNDNVFTVVLSLLLSSDENILIESNKTMNEILSTGIYSTAEYENKLFTLFPKFKESSKLGLFSKLISSLINGGEEEPGLSVAEPAYEFGLPLLSKSCSQHENALGLDIFSTLAELSPEYVEDHVVDCLEIASSLLNSDDGLVFPSASLFLSIMAANFTSESRDTILGLLPRLLQIVKGGSNIETKQLTKVALNTADIVKQFDLRDTSPELISIAIKMLDNQEYKIILSGAKILNILSKSLLPEDAEKVFSSIIDYLKIIESEEIVTELWLALKKLLKKYKVITFEMAESIIVMINNGKIPSCIRLYEIEESESPIFEFFTAFVNRFKVKALPYIKQLVSIIHEISTEALPGLLDPVAAAIKLKIFPDEDISKILVITSEMINDDDSDVATSLLTTIIEIYRSYPTLVDISSVLRILSDLWEAVDETEEDFELPLVIALLTLELCAGSENGEGVNAPLLIDILEILPYSPKFCDLEHVADSVIKISQRGWIKEKELVEPLAHFMAKVCLMKKSEIDKYEVTPGIITNLRNTLKKFVKENKEVEQFIRKSFSSSPGLESLLK